MRVYIINNDSPRWKHHSEYLHPQIENFLLPMDSCLFYWLFAALSRTKTIVSENKFKRKFLAKNKFLSSMVFVQKRIATGLEVLQFFTMHKWNFKSDNFNGLVATQTPDEYEMFLFDSRNTGDEAEYLKNSFLGARQYCFRDSLSSLPKARLILKM